MCIALPMRILSLDDSGRGVVEYQGVTRKISVRLLPDLAVGDFVLVHAGFAIEKVAPDKASSQLALLEELKAELDCK